MISTVVLMLYSRCTKVISFFLFAASLTTAGAERITILKVWKERHVTATAHTRRCILEWVLYTCHVTLFLKIWQWRTDQTITTPQLWMAVAVVISSTTATAIHIHIHSHSHPYFSWAEQHSAHHILLCSPWKYEMWIKRSLLSITM